MKLVCSLIGLALICSVSVNAQLKSQLETEPLDVKNSMVQHQTPNSLIGGLFSPQNFKMMHSYSMSVFSGGGATGSLGMYTNTMLFRLSSPLTLKVNTGIAHQPFGGPEGVSSQGAKFMHGAELIYAPSEKFQMRIGYSNNPFYSGYSPGYYPGMFRTRNNESGFGAGAFQNYQYGGDQ